MIIPKEVRKKPVEYLSLFVIFLVFFFLYFFIDDNQFKRWIIYSAGIVYFCWSLYHHYKRGDLQLSIVIEYLLIILIGIVFISGTLF
ncbi:MAG: hypothetical protein PHH12_00460 [Candidatus Shapirobacteria bacterium]|jgi:hypothetical protein|nr:hypothetical protein [Candidatus Shapirobacteria bacterium]